MQGTVSQMKGAIDGQHSTYRRVLIGVVTDPSFFENLRATTLDVLYTLNNSHHLNIIAS